MVKEKVVKETVKMEEIEAGSKMWLASHHHQGDSALKDGIASTVKHTLDRTVLVGKNVEEFSDG